MAKSIQQAEAELRTAALESAAARRAYHAACRVEAARVGGWDVFSKTNHAEYAEGWQLACRLTTQKENALQRSAEEFADAIAAEHRAEAL